MQSPFPGMDPFIEAYNWRGFHLKMISRIEDHLVPQLPEPYAISTELNMTANDLIFFRRKDYVADLGITDGGKVEEPPGNYGRAGAIDPPQAYSRLQDLAQRTLTIRAKDSSELVTTIEVLSPSNKVGQGGMDYRSKRLELLRNQVNLVEIDLVRAGTPPFVSPNWVPRTYHFQSIDVVAEAISYWTVGLAERLPTISVPLLPGEVPLVLDLQSVFTENYRSSTLNRVLKYEVDQLKPAPTDEEREVIQVILGA